MSSVVSRIKHEVVGIIPPTVFFFVAFQVIAFTRALMLEQYGIEISTFVTAAVAALVVAKVVAVTDLLPFVNRFPDKPLIYNRPYWKHFRIQSPMTKICLFINSLTNIPLELLYVSNKV